MGRTSLALTMDPYVFNMTAYRGSPISEQFNFVDENDDPIDMSDYGPFTWQVRRTSNGPLLLDLTVDETDVDTGVLVGTATVAQTLAVRPGCYQHDLLDASGAKWFMGSFTLGRNISRI